MQRRRWSKGWFQTVIAHSHDLIGNGRRFGSLRLMLSTLSMLATLAGMLIYPFGTIAFTLRFIFGPPFLSGEWYDNAIDGLAINLVALGVINMFVPTLLAIRTGALRHLGLFVVLLPFYYLLISVATWVAIYDLFAAPFYWFKTDHGFARTSLRRCQTKGENKAKGNRREVAGQEA